MAIFKLKNFFAKNVLYHNPAEMLLAVHVLTAAYVNGAAPKVPVCLEVSNIAWRKSPPYTNNMNSTYTGIVEDIFQHAMKKCCHGKPTYNRGIEFNPQDSLTDVILNNSQVQFIIPVQRDAKCKTVLVFPFIPLVVSPGFAVFIKPIKAGLSSLGSAITPAIPLLAVMLLSTGIVGTLYWMAENMTLAWHGETPERFFPGVINGIWWAFVTMSTVGYGDITPKTKPGRILSVLWVIVGIIFLGVFISTITTELLITLSTKEVEIANQRVGVLRGSEELKYAFKAQGVTFEYDSVSEIARALRKQTVNIALVDVIIAGYYDKELMEFTLDRIIEVMTSNGVIFLNKGLKYESCVRNFVFDQQNYIVNHISKNAKVVKYHSHQPVSTSMLLDPTLPTFHNSLFLMSGAIILFLLCGIIRGWSVREVKEGNNLETRFLNEREKQVDELQNNQRQELIDAFADIRESCDLFINNLKQYNTH